MGDSVKMSPGGDGKAPVHSSTLTSSQIKMMTSKYQKQIVVAVLLMFCFFDVLGTVLFMPAGPILCQRAKGGPIDSYVLFAHVPVGMLDPVITDQLPGAFMHLYLDLDVRAKAAGKCPIGQPDTMCRMGYTSDEIRTMVIHEVGMPLAFKENPMSFSSSNNFLAMLASLSGGIGSAIWGVVSDKIGRKICMLMCHIGGIAGYFIMFLAGTEWNSYWGYVLGLSVNGLFSGSTTIVTAYFLDVLPRKEAEGPNGMVMSLSILGAAIGSLILMPFISGRAENLFDACYIAMAGTAFSFIMVALFVVEPNKDRCQHKKEKEESTSILKDAKQSNMAQEASVPEAVEAKVQMTKATEKILWITCIAGAFDSAGDEGTRIARGTVLQNTWPKTNDLMFQNLLLLSLVGLIFLVLILVTVGKQVIGLGKCAFLGAIATLITQLLLNYAIVKWETYTAFLGCWFAGKLFGMCSSFAAMFIVNDFAPADAVGTWGGRLQLTFGAMEAISTMSIAGMYDAYNDGSDEGIRGVNAMFLTAGISFVACLAYAPLALMVQKPIDTEKAEKKFMSIEAFEALSDLEYKRLNLEELDYIEMKRFEQGGKLPRVMYYGNYDDHLPEIDFMMQKSVKDFEYLKRTLIDTLTSAEKIEMNRQMAIEMEKNKHNLIDMARQQKEMGEWIVRYLQDAGYDSWSQFPQFYKVMFMSAFPPIDKLDGVGIDWETCDVEQVLMGFLTISDGLIAQSKNYFRTTGQGAVLGGLMIANK